jgi:peroxiredoxin
MVAEDAKSVAPKPLTAGDNAPCFVLPDPNGTLISSAELLSKGTLVVTFYRGVWCPYCQTDLRALAVAEPEIRSCGASIVAIAHQTAPNRNGKFQRGNGIRFPILHDEGDVAVAYGIRWSPQELALMEAQLGKLAGLNTETSWMLPMQARYVIGADGMIAYADINADYRHQPEPAEILPVLRRLQSGTSAGSRP